MTTQTGSGGRPVPRSAGLPEEVVLRLAGMQRREGNGRDQRAILLEAMGHGLIRFRGHGGEVTFETTLPLEIAIAAASRFMAEHFGPLTWVRFNQLPDGPCVGVAYLNFERALEAGDLSCLVAPSRTPEEHDRPW